MAEIIEQDRQANLAEKRKPAKHQRAPRGRSGATATASADAPASATTKQRAKIPTPSGASTAAPAAQQEPATTTPPARASAAAPAPAAICAELIELQRQRRFCIRLQSQIDRGLEARLARQLGYHTELPEAEGREIFKRAAAIRRAVVTDDQLARLDEREQKVAREWHPLILQTEQSRVGWDRQRHAIEAAMEALAQQLPVWSWAEPIRGFTAKGLAIIVAEACSEAAPELGAYRSHQNLCKRLGLGVVAGHRQGSPGKEASADDWIAEGYDKTRRAEIWAVLDYSLLLGQWRAARGDNEAYPLGSYGAIYSRQVAEYGRRGWKHAKRAAARFMAKCLIRDLWRAWRRSSSEIQRAKGRSPFGASGGTPAAQQEPATQLPPERASSGAPASAATLSPDPAA